MKLFIPMANGQNIPFRVFNSLTKQGIDIDIVPCCSDGVINSNHTNPLTSEQRRIKLNSELINRNLAINFSKDLGDEFIAMQDRDLVHLKNDNFNRCIDFLVNNKDYAGICMPWKEYLVTDHIRLTCFIIRTSIFKELKFRIDKRNHLCATFSDDISFLGYKWGFLPSNYRLVEEI
jgi:hypothetical protein